MSASRALSIFPGEMNRTIFFEHLATGEDPLAILPEHEPRMERLRGRLGDLRGKRIFEPGCGAGPLTKRLAEWVGVTGHILAMDSSAGMVAWCERDRIAGTLAHGAQRALDVALALAAKPRLLLLDEPMAGMGQEDVSVIAELIRQVAKTRAVLMVEHNLSVVADICHHVTVLQRGEILAEGDYATVSSDPRVRTAYMGTEDAQ